MIRIFLSIRLTVWSVKCILIVKIGHSDDNLIAFVTDEHKNSIYNDMKQRIAANLCIENQIFDTYTDNALD